MPEVLRFVLAIICWPCLAVSVFFLIWHSEIPLRSEPRAILSLMASVLVVCGAVALLFPQWKKLSRIETMKIPTPLVPTRPAYWDQGYGVLVKRAHGLKKGNSETISTGNIIGAPCGNVQVGGSNNQANTNCQSIPFRILTEEQKQGIRVFVETLPESVKITVGGVFGSADAVNYAGYLLPLFDGRHLDNQNVAAIRVGIPSTWTNVFVGTVTEQDSAVPYRDALVDTLVGLGITAHKANGSKIPPGDLEVLVGFRPAEVMPQ